MSWNGIRASRFAGARCSPLSCGGVRCFTVRSATAGRSAISRWQCWPTVIERVHMAMLLRGWSDDVVLLTGGSGGLAAGQLARLSVAGIAVDDREVMALTSVQGEPSGQGQLSAVVFADGSRLPRRGLLVAVTLHQLCGLATQLGVAFDTAGPVSEQAVEVDALFRTSGLPTWRNS